MATAFPTSPNADTKEYTSVINTPDTIIGATKVHHVEDAADAINIELTDDEIKTMEELADKANINTIRVWEKEMK
ncbi:hypothetical protein [uncultured Methanobrevibacter sp.]|uniref:hypothetical protein n=1 Tax=uncultured Methanobrevibacter sp. TaxID=253161 RepID=UPI0025D27708|nr:hypothetical protein [uncultured Methanobrevibacter sp.]